MARAELPGYSLANLPDPTKFGVGAEQWKDVDMASRLSKSMLDEMLEIGVRECRDGCRRIGRIAHFLLRDEFKVCMSCKQVPPRIEFDALKPWVWRLFKVDWRGIPGFAPRIKRIIRG